MPESISQPYDFSSLVHSRRSVRKYDLTAEFDHQAVARALELCRPFTQQFQHAIMAVPPRD